MADVLPPLTSDATPITPDWTMSDQWGGWGASRFRHTNGMNVLFFDGHVDTRNSAAINPFISSIGNSVWKPTSDPAFSRIGESKCRLSLRERCGFREAKGNDATVIDSPALKAVCRADSATPLDKHRQKPPRRLPCPTQRAKRPRRSQFPSTPRRRMNECCWCPIPKSSSCTPRSCGGGRGRPLDALVGKAVQPGQPRRRRHRLLVPGAFHREPGDPGLRFSPHDFADALFLRRRGGDGPDLAVHLPAATLAGNPRLGPPFPSRGQRHILLDDRPGPGP